MTAAIGSKQLPLPLLLRGKVRDVHEVGTDRLLLVASDRISAFDVILEPPIPRKGEVLTRLSAFWFSTVACNIPNHFLTSDFDQIVADLPELEPHREYLAGRTTMVQRTRPIPFECVVRGYLAGSAWQEYRHSGTLAGEPLPAGLVEAGRLDPPLFSPATKAASGHDQNITFETMCKQLGEALALRLRELSFTIYRNGHKLAGERGVIIADTKFEFGLDGDDEPVLIDELLTPDSSRFWPAAEYLPGQHPHSLDKQPVRDWLASEQVAGRWDGNAPAPTLPAGVVAATTTRYLDAYSRLTGVVLPGALS